MATQITKYLKASNFSAWVDGGEDYANMSSNDRDILSQFYPFTEIDLVRHKITNITITGQYKRNTTITWPMGNTMRGATIYSGNSITNCGNSITSQWDSPNTISGSYEWFYPFASSDASFIDSVKNQVVTDGLVVSINLHADNKGSTSGYRIYGKEIKLAVTYEDKPLYLVEAMYYPEEGSTTGSARYWEGETATFTAIPNEGYKFVKWSDGNTDNPRSFVVTGDVAYAAVFEKITYIITATAGTGGTVSGGGTYEHGSNITLKAVPSAGYKFVKWSDGVTTASRTITVTANASYTAVFSPICVLYDSIFNFYRWVERGITSGRGTISNINDFGFTFTSSVDDGYTGYSHMFAVEPGKKYTLEYDCSGGTSNQTFVFFHSANGDYSWTKLFDSASKKWSFTVPDGFYLASIRVDVNTKGETINYSNFRIYPADCDYMGNTLKAVDRFDSAKWSMPTPTRDCYIFQGWNTKADGSGKFYTEADAYPTEDLILYSIWKADPPKISDVQLLYGGKVVSSSNKVPAGQSFILKCKLS